MMQQQSKHANTLLHAVQSVDWEAAKPQLAVRPGFGKAGTATKCLANYFRVRDASRG